MYSSLYLSLPATAYTCCSTVSLATFSGSISTMAGLVVHCLARFITSSVKVAENSRVWRSLFGGV
ncbi:hypothetical protein D9M73_285850 [compost metagenome]